jgi:phosphate transport system substrate-binding protein
MTTRILWMAVAIAATRAAAAGPIHGAGATFPAPVYEAWATAYPGGMQLSYDAVGSGAGIERIRQHQVDFGASDAPLSAADLAART